jgi:hypothetical protein
MADRDRPTWLIADAGVETDTAQLLDEPLDARVPLRGRDRV